MSERESSQPGGAACRQAGWWSEEGWGGRASGFISYCQPKLVFPEQKCQLLWHVFCLPVFSNTHPDAAAGHLLVPPWRMQHPRTYTQYGGRSYFHLMLHSVAAHGVVCVYVVETSEMERVRAFVSFTLPVLLWGTACLSLPEDLTFKQMEWTAPCLQLKPEGPSLLCTQ